MLSKTINECNLHSCELPAEMHDPRRAAHTGTSTDADVAGGFFVVCTQIPMEKSVIFKL